MNAENNMTIWNKVKQPPNDALKPIQAGRLKGKTDISPQWRMEVMTELFGPVGIGWNYEIGRLWTEPGAGGEVFAFALVSVWFYQDGKPSEKFPGIGGSMLVQGEKAGLHNNDEAFKMAVTDALSVALKALGVASDIYRGKFDGSKYRDDVPEQEAPQEYKFKPPTANRKTIEERRADAHRFLNDNLKHLILGQEELFRAKIDACDNHADMAAIAVAMKAAIEKQAQEAIY